MVKARIEAPLSQRVIENLARREIDPEDYMAMWEAVLDKFLRRDPRTEHQRHRSGICEMRSLVAKVTEAYFGMYEFFSVELEDNIPFDWKWCPALIEAIQDFQGRITHTGTWQIKLVIGLKALHKCQSRQMADLDLSTLNNGWHFGPRLETSNGIEQCLREDAHFWGVYGRNDEGLATHVADCKTQADAELLTAALRQLYPD